MARRSSPGSMAPGPLVLGAQARPRPWVPRQQPGRRAVPPCVRAILGARQVPNAARLWHASRRRWTAQQHMPTVPPPVPRSHHAPDGRRQPGVLPVGAYNGEW